MAATEIAPPAVAAGVPDAIVDLQTARGAGLVSGRWRYADARVEEIDFTYVGEDLGPGTAPSRTYDVVPHAEGVDYDDSDWRELTPEETQLRLGAGRVSFNWYRLAVTLPERIGSTDLAGATVVFECVVDDYAEVWVDGRLPLALGDAGGAVVSGFNAPNRVVLTRDATPGQTIQVAVFGINGPISTSPRNYIWMRSATLDVYAAGRDSIHRSPLVADGAHLSRVLAEDACLERLATGFVFTEGPVWRDGALLFSAPNENTIFRWADGVTTVFRVKSGYTGVDVGRYVQPGSNGLTFDGEGRLTMCQHGNRRVIRVNPHGDITVLADAFDGQRLNSPNDLVYRSDGTLYFTDPPFGLPEPADAELDFSGVYRVSPDGSVSLESMELAGPNGLAFSPDEQWLYVGDWDLTHKVVVRYPVLSDGSLGPGEEFFDMTDAPGEDAIDGLKVDVEGNVWVCGPGGVWVLSRDGEHLGTLRLPEAPHNLAFGDDDGRSLYICALTSVYRIRTRVPGIRP